MSGLRLLARSLRWVSLAAMALSAIAAAVFHSWALVPVFFVFAALVCLALYDLDQLQRGR